jgi:hypothetical protein
VPVHPEAEDTLAALGTGAPKTHLP